MIIKVTECVGTDGGLFRDLGTYTDVSKWLKAMCDGEDSTRALDVTVVAGGKPYQFKSSGNVSGEANKIIRAVARLPMMERTIPNDRMKITADAFEGELLIELE